ncbi:FAR-17a/AIG1-like protein [Penicillium sp. DV-2018c]|nr:FAR-17a/AIG1-like protein [Penicillium sp. DV-2018c]KAJ5571614.1 FAR-17a/AIG1-like protein [Penicillium sp. DV-2018c]
MAADLLNKHPLQRLPSPSRGLSALVHLVGLSSFFMHDNPNHANQAYGWHFQYLTVIGLTLSTFTFAIALLADITSSRRLFLLKNILSTCSAPLEVVISVLYWGLRLIDERLVIPEDLDIPMYADVSFHATPSVVMLIDLLFLSPPWTITVLPSLALSSTIAFGYWFWIEQCFSKNGWYPYPIFEALPTEGRIALFSLSAVVMAMSTITLKWLHARLNGSGTPITPVSRPGDIKRKNAL